MRSDEDATVLVRACTGVGCRQRVRAGRAPLAAPSPSLWCSTCRTAAARELARLPHLYEECVLALDARGGTELRERTTTSATQPSLPFNAAAADARQTLLDVLASWCGLVADQRRVVAPPRKAAVLAAFLVRHLDWLSRHPAAPELSDELAHLVRLLHRAAYSPTTRRIRLGGCVEAACAGELVAMIGQQDRRTGTDIVCGADPAHRWDERQWLELSRRMTAGRPAPASPRKADADRWFSAAEVSRLWQVPAGTVYRLAGEEQWQRRTARGRTRYLETDVARTFQRRAQRTPGCASVDPSIA